MENDEQQQPEPMTDERLAEIRARVEQAPPGPWRVEVDESASGYYYIVLPDGHTIANVWGDIGWDDADAAALFSHARADIPALLAEVERLRAFVRDVLAIDADTDTDQDGDEYYYYVSPADFGAVIDKASAMVASWGQQAESEA